MFKALVFAVLAVAATWAGAEAALLVENTDVDLGFVYRDEPQKMVFPLINVSSDSLRFLSIEPSCDCTTAQVVPGVVPPQGKGEIVVFFDPKGYETRGKVTESVHLVTSDRKTPEILLTFTIQVGIGPEPEPSSLAFGSIAKGKSDTLALVIHPAKSGPGVAPALLHVAGTKAGDSRISVKELGTDDNGDQRFAVAITNTSGGGEVSSYVSIGTSDELKPEIRIPVTASLPGDVAAEPGVVAFGAALPGAYLQQTVKIWSPAKTAFKIESVTSQLAQFDFEVAPVDQASYQLKIRVKAAAAPGRVNGAILVKTDRPGEPPLEIKVAGHVRSAK